MHTHTCTQYLAHESTLYLKNSVSTLTWYTSAHCLYQQRFLNTSNVVTGVSSLDIQFKQFKCQIRVAMGI